MLERLEFADLWIVSGPLQVFVRIFRFQKIPVREMMESHSELRLVIRLIVSQWRLAFNMRRDVDCDSC